MRTYVQNHKHLQDQVEQAIRKAEERGPQDIDYREKLKELVPDPTGEPSGPEITEVDELVGEAFGVHRNGVDEGQTEGREGEGLKRLLQVLVQVKTAPRVTHRGQIGGGIGIGEAPTDMTGKPEARDRTILTDGLKQLVNSSPQKCFHSSKKHGTRSKITAS